MHCSCLICVPPFLFNIVSTFAWVALSSKMTLSNHIYQQTICMSFYIIPRAHVGVSSIRHDKIILMSSKASVVVPLTPVVPDHVVTLKSVAVRTVTVAATIMHLSLDGARPRPAEVGKCIASGTAQVHAVLRAIYPAAVRTLFLPNFTRFLPDQYRGRPELTAFGGPIFASANLEI